MKFVKVQPMHFVKNLTGREKNLFNSVGQLLWQWFSNLRPYGIQLFDKVANQHPIKMGGHHAEPYKVPHPSIYKVENVPQLKEVKEALARQGLSDPWLRNEAWRYEKKAFGTHKSRLTTFMFRGLGVGFAAFLATIGIEYALGIGKGQGDHGHGHGHDEGHH